MLVDEVMDRDFLIASLSLKLIHEDAVGLPRIIHECHQLHCVVILRRSCLRLSMLSLFIIEHVVIRYYNADIVNAKIENGL